MFDAVEVWSRWQALRSRGPLVHCITNFVAMEINANVLLAAGASPAMVHAVEEVEDFTAIADSVVVNIGTLSPPWVTAMDLALREARATKKPCVLDPVGVGATPYRTRVAHELLNVHRPTVVRANASEVLALCGSSARTKGVDSVDSADDAVDAAKMLAAEFGVTVVVTGQADRITDGQRVATVRNGSPLMTRVTALGCSLSALIGGFVAVEPDPVLAAAAGTVVYAVCGQVAAASAAGPGSLKTGLLDTLHTLTEAQFLSLAQLEVT